jgi:hypothetical protein
MPNQNPERYQRPRAMTEFGVIVVIIVSLIASAVVWVWAVVEIFNATQESLLARAVGVAAWMSISIAGGSARNGGRGSLVVLPSILVFIGWMWWALTNAPSPGLTALAVVLALSAVLGFVLRVVLAIRIAKAMPPRRGSDDQ